MHTPEVSDQMCYLSSKSAELRGTFVLNGEFTIRSTMISMFLHNCLMTLRKYDMAFFYLREAITMMLMLRMDDTATMSKLDVQERARRQRPYWAALIQERFLAIADHRQVMLPPLGSGTPELDPSLPPGVHEGFTRIIELFSLVDDEFLRNWLSSLSSSASTTVTARWIEQKHRELEDKELLHPCPCLPVVAQRA